MATSYVGFTTGQRQIEADETGINTESFSVRYYPFFKDFVIGYNGMPRGFAIPDKLNREITIIGKVIVGSTTGLMLAVWNLALTPANDIGDFIAVTSGSNAGGVYLEEVTVDQTNEGWRTANFKLRSDPGIA